MMLEYLLFALATFLFGYFFGKRLGMEEGREEGKALARLLLREQSFAEGCCALCHSSARPGERELG